MKNQYFGDNRDLFKYDLILQVIQKTGSINHFMFIPMLTPNVTDKKGTGRDGEKRDRKKAKAGRKNDDLVEFLDKFKEKSKRDYKQIRSFFKKYYNIEVKIHKEDKYFSSSQRQEYFEGIKNDLLSKSLIFADPDNGLQILSSGKEHILYSEVKDLYDRMDKASILMIYQHFPRNEKHKKYLVRRSNDLERCVGYRPIYISDNQIVFFLLTKNAVFKETVGGIISNYERCYPSLVSSFTQK